LSIINCSNRPATETFLCHVRALKKKLGHCYNFRRRLAVVLASTSAGPDVSLGGNSCLARLVGLLLNWVSLIYCSSMFMFVFFFFFFFFYMYIYLQGCFCHLQNIRAPKSGSHATSIPVLARIGSWTLDFRESKCFPRGP